MLLEAVALSAARIVTSQVKDPMRTRFALAIPAIGLAVVLSGATNAHADTNSISQTLARATPTTVEQAADVTPAIHSGVAVAYSSGSTTATVPRDPVEGISLSGDNGAFTVQLPEAANSGQARQVGLGSVSYDNGDGSITVPIVEDDASVQITTVISSSSAPATYRYAIDVPGGGRLVPDTNGAISILSHSGAWIGGVAPAWAKDARGRAVPTSYTVEGNRLLQRVDLSDPTVSYPVVADPWLGKALINHTRWANTWKYSPTLQVFPTPWGRVAPAVADKAAWSETLSKTARARHPNPGTAAMRTQFDCHWYAVRIKSPRKPSWDLDSKLPNTSLANEIKHGCNYPASKREF